VDFGRRHTVNKAISLMYEDFHTLTYVHRDWAKLNFKSMLDNFDLRGVCCGENFARKWVSEL
jgi:hypothetical protein